MSLSLSRIAASVNPYLLVRETVCCRSAGISPTVREGSEVH